MLRLAAVWRVEVMALRERLECEVREDVAESFRHLGEVVRVAQAPESEVDRLREAS